MAVAESPPLPHHLPWYFTAALVVGWVVLVVIAVTMIRLRRRARSPELIDVGVGAGDGGQERGRERQARDVPHRLLEVGVPRLEGVPLDEIELDEPAVRALGPGDVGRSPL